MPIIRINARQDTPLLHAAPRDLDAELRRLDDDGPVIVMIHGYKYEPGSSGHCPHRHLFAIRPEPKPWPVPDWPRQLGFCAGHAGEGLGIAFGWSARHSPRRAVREARQAGLALADVVERLHRRAPRRPIHLIAHSMGIELALSALHHLPAGAVQRIISMTGAAYRSSARDALASAAGRGALLINIASRENDLFDFLYECLIPPPERGDRAIGAGIEAENAVTLQLDNPETLAALARLGHPLDAPRKRICHWSSYTRPGVLRLYNDMLRRPEIWTLKALKHAEHPRTAPRWSRLVHRPLSELPLFPAQKAS